jgi:hypothetical protein
MTANLDAIHQCLGRFFVAFSEVERELGAALVSVFKLNGHPSRDVIVGEIDFARKLTILDAAAETATTLDDKPADTEWKEEVKSTIKKLHAMNGQDRVLLAHAYLQPREVNNRPVLCIERRRPATWTTEDFEQKIAGLNKLANRLHELAEELTTLKIIVGEMGAIEGSDTFTSIGTVHDHNSGREL